MVFILSPVSRTLRLVTCSHCHASLTFQSFPSAFTTYSLLIYCLLFPVTFIFTKKIIKTFSAKAAFLPGWIRTPYGQWKVCRLNLALVCMYSGNFSLFRSSDRATIRPNVDCTAWRQSRFCRTVPQQWLEHEWVPFRRNPLSAVRWGKAFDQFWHSSFWPFRDFHWGGSKFITARPSGNLLCWRTLYYS